MADSYGTGAVDITLVCPGDKKATTYQDASDYRIRDSVLEFFHNVIGYTFVAVPYKIVRKKRSRQ